MAKITEEGVSAVKDALDHVSQFQIINGDLIAFFPDGEHSTFRAWDARALDAGLIAQTGWQFFSPFNQVFVEVEDDSIAKRLSDEYLKIRGQQKTAAEAEVAKEAARSMTGEEVRSLAAGVKGQLVRAIVAHTENSNYAYAIDPAQFNPSQIRPKFALAGVIAFTNGFYGGEFVKMVARGVPSEDWARKCLAVVEQRAVAKRTRMNRTEYANVIKDGTLFN